MKNLFVAMALFTTLGTSAQVSKVSLQASGLTCSMCSNSINKALKTLPAVDNVMSNIKTSTFEITFKPGADVNFDDLKKKVEGAGFSVAKLNATVNFTKQSIQNDEHLKVGGMMFHFVNVKNQTLNGTQSIQVIDKGFLSTKDFKKNEALTKMDCYKSGTATANTKGVATGTRIYHVTI